MQNLAYEQDLPQGQVVQFPKKEHQAMSKKDEGYTRMPNSLIDGEIMASLNDKSFKCLMFILRQTTGFGRSSHTIAITQFQKYCGIKKRDTVISAIHDLESCKLILVGRKTGCLNTYSPTLDQYQQKGLVPTKGTSTTKQDGTSTTKQDTIKENFKETLKENNKNTAQENFEPQNRGALNFIDYHSDDQKSYTLKDLSGVYPIKNDFMAQAAVSYPNLSEAVLLEQLKELAQWSVGQTPRRSQKWMTTWLNWLKNYQAPKPTKPKTSKKTNSNLNVNDAWKDQAVHHTPVENLHVDIPEDFV